MDSYEDIYPIAIVNIKEITLLMLDKCQIELVNINRALGKKNRKTITLDDMYNRTFGPYLKQLAESI